MRVLIDYRPALRERTGVGEYTHELVKALARAIDPGKLDLTVFSSSWRDRLRLGRTGPERCSRCRSASAGPCPQPRVASPGLAYGRSAGRPAVRCDAFAPPAAAALARGRPGDHDSRFELPRNPDQSRSDVRRDYPALAHEHASRADRVIVVSQYVAGEVERRLNVPRRENRRVFSGGA